MSTPETQSGSDLRIQSECSYTLKGIGSEVPERSRPPFPTFASNPKPHRRIRASVWIVPKSHDGTIFALCAKTPRAYKRNDFRVESRRSRRSYLRAGLRPEGSHRSGGKTRPRSAAPSFAFNRRGVEHLTPSNESPFGDYYHVTIPPESSSHTNGDSWYPIRRILIENSFGSGGIRVRTRMRTKCNVGGGEPLIPASLRVGRSTRDPRTDLLGCHR